MMGRAGAVVVALVVLTLPPGALKADDVGRTISVGDVLNLPLPKGASCTALQVRFGGRTFKPVCSRTGDAIVVVPPGVSGVLSMEVRSGGRVLATKDLMVAPLEPTELDLLSFQLHERALKTGLENMHRALPVLQVPRGVAPGGLQDAIRTFAIFGEDRLALALLELEQLGLEEQAFIGRALANLGAEHPEMTALGMGAVLPTSRSQDFSLFYSLVDLDAYSMLMTNLSTILGPVALVCWFIPSAQAVAAALEGVQGAIDIADVLIDSCLPTDLEALRLVVPAEICVGQDASFSVVGDFVVQGGDLAQDAAKDLIGELFGAFGGELANLLWDLLSEPLVEIGYNSVDEFLVNIEDCFGATVRISNVPVPLDFYRGNLATVLQYLGVLLPSPWTLAVSILEWVIEATGWDLQVFDLPFISVASGKAYLDVDGGRFVPLSPGATTLALQGWRFNEFKIFEICLLEVAGRCLYDLDAEYEWLEAVDSSQIVVAGTCSVAECRDRDGDGYGVGSGCQGWDCDDLDWRVHAPDCFGRRCGPDGCGGSCGECPGMLQCDEDDGQCGCRSACGFDRVCGPDGCGGVCGYCRDGDACIGGQCHCVRDCDGRSCGEDGCGGSCGQCGNREECDHGRCVSVGGLLCEPCVRDDDCGRGHRCIASGISARYCVPDCNSHSDCPTGFLCTGGVCVSMVTRSCDQNGRIVTVDFCDNVVGVTDCQPGQMCRYGQCVCRPSCLGRECGSDGCGGLCGACAAGWSCNGFGTCDMDPCVPDCGSRECGFDRCGDACGTCAASQVCVRGRCLCQPRCGSKDCGDDGCGGTCGECFQGTCVDGQCICFPDCNGRECGTDGCGGSCGRCAPGESCEDGRCVCKADDDPCATMECGRWYAGCSTWVDCGECGPGYRCSRDAPNEGKCECVRNCLFRICGVDGCGGNCGSCPPGRKCEDGWCLPDCPVELRCGEHCCGVGQACLAGHCCSPDCVGRECGDDGCGGKCGVCDPGEICDGRDWRCRDDVCVPDCKGRSCGSDGCGGTCGLGCERLGDHWRCDAGECVCRPDTCESLGRECGEVHDGCGRLLDCGPAGPTCLDTYRLRDCILDANDGKPGTFGIRNCAEEGMICLDGSCMNVDGLSCETLLGRETLCIGETLVYCWKGVLQLKDCSPDTCGWDSELATYRCVNVCRRNCEERQCGPDGCGGVCGDCSDDRRCTPEGRCCECDPGAILECERGGSRLCTLDCSWSECEWPLPGDASSNDRGIVNDVAVPDASQALDIPSDISPPVSAGGGVGCSVPTRLGSRPWANSSTLTLALLIVVVWRRRRGTIGPRLPGPRQIGR